MRAALLRTHGGAEVLELAEAPTPSPKAGEVLVRVKVSALNHLDIWVREGLPGLKLHYPHILGSDCSGVVESAGKDVKGIKTGDEVIVYPALSCGVCENCREGVESLCPEYRILGEHVSGTNAELISVPERNIFPKPRNVTFEEAAAFPLVYVTAWEMVVVKGNVKAGQTVLIHAAGSGVSTAAIQIAKLLGANVIVTSGSEEKLARAKKLGASEGISYRTQDFVREVKRLAPAGVDLIVDHVGKDFWPGNIRCLKSGGTLVTCGATTGPEAVTDLRHVFYRQLRLLGSTMGSRRHFPTLLEHFAQGRLKSVVDRVYPLSEIRQAHAYLEEGARFGKVLLRH